MSSILLGPARQVTGSGKAQKSEPSRFAWFLTVGTVIVVGMLAKITSCPESIAIELSGAQVGQMLRGALEDRGDSAFASTLIQRLGVLRSPIDLVEDSRLSRSLLSGLLLLVTLPSGGSYMGNARLARLVGMSQSTTHRYLATLLVCGLVERDPFTRQYRRVR